MLKNKNFPGGKKKKGSWIPVISVFVLIVILGFCTGIKKKQVEESKKSGLKEGPPAINVVTMKLSSKSIRDRINLPGVVEPWVKLVVSSEVAGRITAKKSSEGTVVKKGDIIAVVDKSIYISAYNAAKASYESALASKKRLENLYSSKLSNKSELDNITAQAANQKAAMKIAALDLEKCNVKAPISGLIDRVFIEEGQFMDTGNPVASIIQIDRVKINVGIPETDVNAVTKLTDFDVTIDALDSRVFKAKKHYLSKTTSSLARVYDLELELDNKNGEILPDMFARVEIVKKEVKNALSIPLYSVIPDGKKNIVYIANGDLAHKKEIKTGIQEGWMQEITEGLEEGEDVIVVGQRSVADEQKIKIIRTITDPEELIR